MKKTKWDKVYDETYKAIIKYVKNNPDMFEGITKIKFELVTTLSYELENNGVIDFGLHDRGSDTW